MQGISFNFDWVAIIVIVLTVFLSSFVHSAIGIGFGVLFLLLLPKYIGYTGALSIMYILYSFVILYTLIRAGKTAGIWNCIKKTWPGIVGNTLGTVAGTLIMKIIDNTSPDILFYIAGGAFVLIGLYFILFGKRVDMQATTSAGLTLGGVGGILGGIVGVGGPPLAIYMINATDTSYEYIVSIQLSCVIGCITGIIMHSMQGTHTPLAMGAAIIGAVPVIAGTILGVSTAKKVDMSGMKRFIYVFMVVVGLIMIVKRVGLI